MPTEGTASGRDIPERGSVSAHRSLKSLPITIRPTNRICWLRTRYGDPRPIPARISGRVQGASGAGV